MFKTVFFEVYKEGMHFPVEEFKNDANRFFLLFFIKIFLFVFIDIKFAYLIIWIVQNLQPISYCIL